MAPDMEGMKRLFTQFSFPGGIPSHAPETPGSIHEGRRTRVFAFPTYDAAFDNPDLIVTAVVGDGEAETGPLATSWHSNKFLNPVRDGPRASTKSKSDPLIVRTRLLNHEKLPEDCWFFGNLLAFFAADSERT
jgi:hypothetical protein